MVDVSFSVAAGEVVTLLGRNGTGKTTTINALMGLLSASGGEVTFDGLPLLGLPPFRIAQEGLGLVPEGRQVFTNLTIEENLIATSAAHAGRPQWTLGRVYTLSPSSPNGAGIWAISSRAASSRWSRSGARL